MRNNIPLRSEEAGQDPKHGADAEEGSKLLSYGAV